MPIYEYQCSECEHRLEALQKISDPLLTDCPECGKSALTKLISAASFRLKGGGWYETDFKKDGKKHLAESDSAASTSAKSDSKSDNKSDSKADKKADTASGSGKSSDSNKSSSGKAKSQPAN